MPTAAPVPGTVERESGQGRLRVAHDATGKTLVAQVHQVTQIRATLFTDRCQSDNHPICPHATLAHGTQEWAR